ncbi:hypothetical protein TTHERM_00697090 (macronuclear) [Tetrahymena thermophila SB210]|uniref:Uncharacterized protein n=1 Tax=Tetrahymena thermophila (strain SB210) TaxID=312017 RepID=Q24C62_TETTS|nr:hypothetical protein TTHERM_00697090 [Tetrahymena thermophila SB210]EAS05376.3 hypothetical protein TTHERM_00697090 [Tetrahymena thermophila SB210]|eukprot:XP_001025621.3 hypothetical protein TTHERM_00697090 [Tetrahymena thermophila SB210]
MQNNNNNHPYYRSEVNYDGNGQTNYEANQHQKNRPSTAQSALSHSKSASQFPFLYRNQQPKVKDLRTQEEKDAAIKHLISPTKSLQLRSEIVKKSKNQQKMMELKNSRVLDNHFLHNIHSCAWISPGLFRRMKYESDDTGLAITFPDNAYEVKLNQDRQEVQKMQKDGIRNWGEYEKIRDGEFIVTIEYCTNCHEHQGTTRHDEKKYEYIAQNLKKEILRHYPVIKVYMKPLITENQDHSIENLYARSRLGAMEVQICSNKNGRITKNILFSKLKTKTWPSTLSVLNEIRKYMGTCTLTIQLIHEFIDPQSLRDDQKRTSENKLFNVEVILRPYRKINQSGYTQQQNQNSYVNPQQSQTLDPDRSQIGGSRVTGFDGTMSKSRPNSALFRSSVRPLSAQSAYTVQSYSQLPQNEGYQTNGKTIEIKEKSSTEGIVNFKDLPFDVYNIEIKETNDFRAYRDRIDIFKKWKEESQQDGIILEEIHLQPVEYTFAKFILEFEPNSQVKGSTEAIIRICKEGDEENELEGRIAKVFEVTLDPGKYRVVVEHPVYGTIEKDHTFQFGNQELKLAFDSSNMQANQSQTYNKKQTNNNTNQQQQGLQNSSLNNRNNRPSSARPQSGNLNPKKELIIQIYEAGNFRNNIQNCKIEIKDEVKEKIEMRTNDDGICVIKLDGFTKGTIKIEHDDFLTIMEDYGPTTMNINSMKDLSFPLIRKPEKDSEVNLLMLTDADRKIMTLNVITPDGITIAPSKKEAEKEKKEVVINDDPEQRSSVIKIQKIKQKGVYRIFAKVHDINLLSPSSVKLYVITSSTKMHFIEVPKSHPQIVRGNDIYWDIGALCVSTPEWKFIEVNSVKSDPVTKDSYLLQLKQITDYINSKVQKNKGKGSVDVRTLFGFPKEENPKVLKNNNDYFVSKENIVNNIDINIFGGTKNPFTEHLINSALQSNGLVSLNKLKSKFESNQFPEGIDFYNDGSVKEVNQEDEEDE